MLSDEEGDGAVTLRLPEAAGDEEDDTSDSLDGGNEKGGGGGRCSATQWRARLVWEGTHRRQADAGAGCDWMRRTGPSLPLLPLLLPSLRQPRPARSSLHSHKKRTQLRVAVIGPLVCLDSLVQPPSALRPGAARPCNSNLPSLSLATQRPKANDDCNASSMTMRPGPGASWYLRLDGGGQTFLTLDRRGAGENTTDHAK